MNSGINLSFINGLSEDTFLTFFTSSDIFPLAVIDVTIEKIQLNQAATKLTGLNSANTSAFFERIHEADRGKTLNRFKGALTNKEEFKINIRWYFAADEERFIQLSGKPLIAKDGQPAGIMVHLNDISEQTKIHEEIDATLEMASFALETPNPVFRVSKSGKLLFANAIAEELLDKLGIKNHQITDSAFLQQLGLAFEKNNLRRYILSIDQSLTYSITIVPQEDHHYANVYTSDISEIAELQLKISQNLADIKAAINSTDDIIVLMDDLMHIIAFNQSAEKTAIEIFGKKLANQMAVNEFLDEKTLYAFERHFAKCLSRGIKSEFETIFQFQNSKQYWFRILFNPVFEENSSNIIGVCMNVKNITSTKDDLQQLETQKSFYETILDNIPADIAIFDDQHRYLYVNPQGIKDKNLRTWMIGKTDFDYCKFRGIGTAIAEERSELFKKVLEQKKEKEIETEHHLPNGDIKHVLRKFYPYYQNGNFKLMIGYGVDITDIKRVQQSFMQSEHRYRTLFENNPLMVFILNKAGTILSINASVSNDLKYEERDIINQPIITYFPEVNRIENAAKITDCFEHPDMEISWETRMTKKTSRLIDIEIRAKVIYSENGMPQLLMVCNNITKRKQNERLLEESEKLNRRLIQELPLPVGIIQEQETILSNEAFRQLVGLPKETENFTLLQYVVPEDKQKLLNASEQLLRGDEIIDYNIKIETVKNEIREVEVRDSLFNYKNQLVTLKILNDITERVRIEQKNKEIEERTKKIIDAALDAVVITDLQGNVVDWNQQAQHIFHWPSVEVLGKKLEDIILPKKISIPGDPTAKSTRLTLNTLIETTGVNSSGNEFPIELFIAQIITSERKLLSFYIRDISIRKEAERKIQESERTDNLLNLFSSAIFRTETIPGILEQLVNTLNTISANSIIDIYLADLEGKNLLKFYSGATVLPSNESEINADNIPFGFGINGDTALKMVYNIVNDRSTDKIFQSSGRNTGSELSAPITVNYLTYAVIHIVSPEVNAFNDQFINLLRKLFEPVSARIAKIIDEQNQLKMTRELIRNNAQLQQYSYIVSHNLRAPIANLLGLSRIFNISNPADQRNQMIIKNIESSANNIDMVLRDLNEILSIKKDLSKSKELIRFDAVMTTVIKGLEREIAGAKPLIKTDFKVDEIKTIKSYLTSIFSNLISNSIKYRAEDRPCEISICTSATPQGTLIEFSDNGIGIDLERFGDKIFGIYKRFHMHVDGTGIGLHLVKTQVEAMNGQISIQSKVNSGTKFNIQFNHD